MKALILAAGSGTRMGKYSAEQPKGMLNFNGAPLISWQLAKFRAAGIEDIAIATGYKSELINFKGIKYFHNPEFAVTNMVETLMCCREFLDQDLLISYSDIIFTGQLLKDVMTFKGKVGVTVDYDWRRYWKLRYGTTEHDLETLEVSKDGRITSLGKEISDSTGIDYRYVGLNFFSTAGLSDVFNLYNKKKAAQSAWIQSGKSFRQGYMTDLLNELIQTGTPVDAVVTKGGWAEFDTENDYETMLRELKAGSLSKDFF